MGYDYLEIATTPSVRAAQAANGSGVYWSAFSGDRTSDRLSSDAMEFIAQRDSFYMATVSETGWPYIQHRGGPAGFLRVLDDRTLAFADFRGNRQYITLGNLAKNDRVSLFLMDYANRARLKIYARSEVRDLTADPDLAKSLIMPGYKAKAERALVFHLEAFDWNCSQHITRRFSASDVEAAASALRQRIQNLEQENKMLRNKIARDPGGAAQANGPVPAI
jgi:predicted pyridoxine 5'-phosphate oxidase superfamily flavin-nucleotide-binding protein